MIDVDKALAVSEDERFTTQAGLAVREFLKSIAGFFTTAQAIEQAAVFTLAKARALTVPTNQEQDAEMQRFVKGTTADLKSAETHWAICATVHGFHKRLVAVRKRATDPLEEANRLSNALHNQYVQAEQRRVAQEQERVRVAAETKAREDREAELAAQEVAALKAEADSPVLSAREVLFVNALVSGVVPYAAAMHAGFKNSVQQAARLMALPKIQDAIQAKRTAAAIREQAEARRQAPLDVQVETVKAHVSHADGHDRSTHSAEIVDPQAFVKAVMGGALNIPLDCLMPNPVKLNEMARALRERISAWPGIRYVKSTKVV